MKYGKIEEQDFALTQYPLDSTAEALVLGDYGRITFEFHPDKGLRYRLDRHVRIKIYNSEGTDWANVEIPLYGRGLSKEEIGRIRAATYTHENGKIEKSKFSRSEAFEDEIYDFLRIFKFSIPNAKPGSIIEYDYTLYSRYVYNLVDWSFQEQIPTQWSELRLRVPEWFTYKQFLSGYEAMDVNETERYAAQMSEPAGTAYRWVMRDVPALHTEPYITTLSDYAARMQFELTSFNIPGYVMENYSSDWNKLNQEFMESASFGKQLKGGRWAEELVAQITAGAGSPEEKAAKIHRYIQQNMRYNGLEQVYAKKPLKRVAEEREGSAAEINLLLTTLLRTAGVPANPVILSTRTNGRVNPFIPMEKDFNYVVACAEVGGGMMLLDATEDMLPPGQLPFRCLNTQGRMLSEGGSQWVKLLNTEKRASAIQADLRITESGLLAGTLERLADGYTAMAQRRSLQLDGEEKYFEEVTKNHQDWTIADYSFQNVDKLGERLSTRYTLEIDGKATQAGDRLYLDPIPVGKLVENPFRQDVRKYPIDYGCPEEQTLMYSYEIPQGYQVEQLPATSILALPDKAGTFRYQVSQMGNKLMVISRFAINRPQFLAEDYAFLKQFYAQVIEKQSEQIVLVKAQSHEK